MSHLESDVGSKFDQQLLPLTQFRTQVIDPKLHLGLRPEQWMVNEELQAAKKTSDAARRVALRKIIMEDFRREQEDMAHLGLTYIPLA